MNQAGGLPEGRRGQAIAVLLLAATSGLAWVLLVAPLCQWYVARAERLTERRTVLAHMLVTADTLPALRRALGAIGSRGPPLAALLGGQTDAMAGAALQGMVQDMAAAAGATLASAEALPGEQQGDFRRIGVRLALSGDWQVLVAMLLAMENNPCRLLIDDLDLHATARIQSAATAAPPIQASFIVLGFRPGREAGPDTAPRTDLRAEAGEQRYR